MKILPDESPVVGGTSGQDGQTRRAIVRLLLESGSITAADIGRQLGISAAGVRRHLDALVEVGDVDAIARRLGFDVVLATPSTWLDDDLLWQLGGDNCYGMAKDARVAAWLEQAGAGAFAFTSDHESDLPLFERALASGGTVLQVAHRLEHVAGYDRVLVMEAGRVAERAETLPAWVTRLYGPDTEKAPGPPDAS